MPIDEDTLLLSPIGHAQLKDDLNKIPVGGKIAVYNTGSTVLAKIYKTPDGVSAWNNPILIDSLGHANLEIWLHALKSYDLILSDNNGNIIQSFIGISGINDPTKGGDVDLSTVGEWILAGLVVDQSPGYVDIQGDWTNKITQFKRLKLVILGERHGWATNVSLLSPEPDPVTRIEYELDEEAVIIGRINSVYYGLISHVNTSFPNFLGGAVYIKRGDDFTADPNMEIWDTSGNFHYVQSTATISSFGSTKKAWPGSLKYLYFRNDVVITPLAGMIKTPSNQDFNVSAGDIIQIILDDSTGISYALGLFQNAADFSQVQSTEKKQTVLSGELNSAGNPYLLKVPKLTRANPIMTANNSPSGFLATASSTYDATATYQPYRAFDGNLGTLWSSAAGSTSGAWINLLLPTAKKVRAYTLGMRNDANVSQPFSWYIQGSNNGVDYEVIDYRFDISGWSISETRLFYITYVPKTYTNFRFYGLSVTGAQPSLTQFAELTYYEFEDDSNFSTEEVPFSPTFGSEVPSYTSVEYYPTDMTSDILPAPYVASAISSYDITSPYLAFDINTNGTGWQSAENFTIGDWIKVDLGIAKSITSYTIASTNNFALKAAAPTEFIIQGSTDNTIWTEIDNQIGVTWPYESTDAKTFQLPNPTIPYRYYRLEIRNVTEMSAVLIPAIKYPPPLLDNIDQGYVVSASSRLIFNIEHNAFDGDKTTDSRWIAFNNAVPQWLQIDFPAPITLGKYILTGSFSVSSPVDWTIEGSTDSSTWVVLDTRVDTIWNADSEDKEFILTAPQGPYSYFRINITKSNILSQPVGVIELELWELPFIQIYKFGAMINNLRFNSLLQIPKGSTADFTYPANQSSQTGISSASRTLTTNPINVPPMTSNTTPAGYITSSSQDYDATYQAWKAFDKKNGASQDAWHTLNQRTGWLKIKLPTAGCVNSYAIEARFGDSGTKGPKDWVVYGSNDDVNWVGLDGRTGQSTWTAGEKRNFYFTVTNYTNFLYYKLDVTLNCGDPNYLTIGEWHLSYHDASPAMTSASAPAPFVISSSSVVSVNYSEWKAFNKSNATETDGWVTYNNNPTGWLKIKLDTPRAVGFYSVQSRNQLTYTTINPRDWVFYGSNDDVNWTNLHSTSGQINWGQTEIRVFSFTNTTSYLYYHIAVSANNGHNQLAIGELQLYYSADLTTSALSAYLAFDGSNSTGWNPGLPFTSGDWLKVDLVLGSPISKYKIKSQETTNPVGGCPKTFTLQGSNDNSAWTVIDTQTNLTWSGSTVVEKTFTLATTSASFRYYRIVITVTSNGQPPYVIDFRVIRTDYIENVTKILPVSTYGVYDKNFTETRQQGFPTVVTVPLMTGDVTPAPFSVSFSSQHASGYWGMRAFDGVQGLNQIDFWHTASGAAFPHWLQFNFGQLNYVYSYTIRMPNNSSSVWWPISWTLIATKDGTNWVTIDTKDIVSSWAANVIKTFEIAENLRGSYLSVRINVTAASQGAAATVIGEMRFNYSPPPFAEKVVPNMTADSYGGWVASASTVLSGGYAFAPFSGYMRSDIRWITNAVSTGWLRINSPYAITVNGYQISGNNESGLTNRSPNTWTFQGSNDGSSWTTLHSASGHTFFFDELKTFYFYNETPYTFHRINVTANNGDTYLAMTLLNLLYKATPLGIGRPALMFDGKNETAYKSGSSTYFYLKVPYQNSISKYSITPSNGSNLLSWTLDGSFNGTVWTILDSRVDVSPTIWKEGIPTEFEVQNPRGVFKFFRISVSKTTGGITPTATITHPYMTSNTAPSPCVVSASTERVSPIVNPAYMAFDNNLGTYWCSTASPAMPQWLKINLGAIYRFTHYEITPSANSGDLIYNPKFWHLYGSTNGTSWSVIDTRAQVSWGVGIPQKFKIFQPGNYSWYYITFYENNEAGAPYYMLVCNLKFSYVDPGDVKLDINEVKMYHKTPYKLYYESNVSSLHSFASGFDDKGWRNIPMEGPEKTYMGVDAFAGNTFISSRLEKDASIAVHENYRFPWLIADDSWFSIDYTRQFPDWPIFWNGANFTFTPTNQTPVMTFNTAPFGFEASAQYEEVDYEAFKAFDSVVDTYWRAGNAQIFSWIKLKLDTPRAIRGVIITAPNLIGVGAPISWTIDGSNDDSTWTVLDSVLGQINWELGEKRTFLFTENTSLFTYYRMNITNASLGSSNHFGVAQIDFYSFPQSTAPTTIEDQYFNKGTISGVIGVNSVVSYNDKSVLDFSDAARLYWYRTAGYETSQFTLEVKWRPKKSSYVNRVTVLNAPGTTLVVDYYMSTGNYLLYLSSAGAGYDIAGGTAGYFPAVIGEWYHVRLNFDGTRYLLTVNDLDLVKVITTTRVTTLTALGIGRDTAGDGSGYFYDFRYLPFSEPPDKVFDMPFYSMLRYDPIKNLSSKLLDINYQFRTGPNRWLVNTEFLVGEYNHNIYGSVTPITYAYGGITYLPITILQQTTGTPDFFQVSHFFGVDEFTNYLFTPIWTPMTPTILNRGDRVIFDSLGMYSGATTWSGTRIPFVRNRNTIGVKWPQNDSADYSVFYGGNQTVVTVSPDALIISGIFRRNF